MHVTYDGYHKIVRNDLPADDRLAPARGIMCGLALAVAFWSVLAVLLWGL